MSSIEKYLKVYSAGQIIFQQGDTGSEMYVIRNGKVRIEMTIYSGETAINKTLGELSKGDFFGEMAIIDNSPRTARAVAIEETELVILNKNGFYKLIEGSPEFAIKIVRRLSDRLKEANERMKKLLSYKKHAQFLKLLKEFAEDDNHFIDLQEYQNILQKTELSETDIAPILKNLENKNILRQQEDKTIQITDHQKLLEIIDFIIAFDKETL